MEILHRKLASEAEAALSILYNCTSATNCDEYCGIGCVYDSSPPAPSPLAAAADESPSPHINHAIPYLVSAACVLGFAFLLLTTCTILLRHRRSSGRVAASTSRDPDQDLGPVDHPIWHIVTVGLPQSVIDSITTVSYKSCDGLIEGSDCSVCLTKFEDGDEVRLLPKCSHAFHLPCIDTWLRSHKNCPLCRAPVVTDPSPVTSNPNSNNPDPSGARESSDDGDDDDDFDTLVTEGARKDEIWKGDPEKRVLSDVGENFRVASEDFEAVRRSISLDSSAAYAINNAVVIDVSILMNGEGSSDSKSEVEEEAGISRLKKSSSSIGRSLQKAPVSVKRSLSSSAKILSSSFREG